MTRTLTTPGRLVSLAEVAQRDRITKERALRRALAEGRASKRDGRWFVFEVETPSDAA